MLAAAVTFAAVTTGILAYVLAGIFGMMTWDIVLLSALGAVLGVAVVARLGWKVWRRPGAR